jgi:hypothetical protein
VTLEQILNLIVSVFHAHGAHHVSAGAVSHHWGWVLTKHWIIRVCHVGAKGCGL